MMNIIFAFLAPKMVFYVIKTFSAIKIISRYERITYKLRIKTKIRSFGKLNPKKDRWV